MPQYNITLAKDASNDELEKAKQHVKDQGGEIVSEFTLIKGFTAKVPDDAVSTLQSNDKITVEHDSEFSFKETATPEDISFVKNSIAVQGGSITQEDKTENSYTIGADVSDTLLTTLQLNDKVNIEQKSEGTA